MKKLAAAAVAVVGFLGLTMIALVAGVAGSSNTLALAADTCTTGTLTDVPASAQGVWDALTQAGWGPIATAGIMGNMQVESGFSPTIVQGGTHSGNPAAAGSGGYGLVQWSPGTKLIPLLNGQAPTVASEVEALTGQLRGSYSKVGRELDAAITPSAAAATFEGGFERDRHWLDTHQPEQNRMDNAEAIYRKYSGISGTATVVDVSTTSCSNGGPGQGATGTAAQLIAYAKTLLGIPYVWGGTTLSGMDCSGFTQYVYRHFGINLPRISADQGRLGPRAGLDTLKPGDLVFWDNSTRNVGADHVAIYIGHGHIIEEPRPGLSSRVSVITDRGEAWGVHLNLNQANGTPR